MLAFGVTFSWDALFGAGPVTILAPPGTPLEVRVDGRLLARVDGGSHLSFHVPRVGTHYVSIKSLTTGEHRRHAVNVWTGSRRTVLPALDGQCFALVQVTPMYAEWARDGTPAQPTVRRRYGSLEPFTVAIEEPWPLPRTVFLVSEPKLPQRLASMRRHDVLLDVPCALAMRDDEILAHLGARL